MKKDNEAKMKEILSELEDELEEINEENIKETVKKEKKVEEETIEDEEVVEEETTEDEEVVEEETTEDEEIVEEETTEDEEVVEEETTEDEEVVEEETTEDEEIVEEETTEDEEIVEEETTEDEEDKKVKNAQIESPIKKVGDYLIEKLNKYKYLLILDFVIFLLLFFLIPTIILEVKPILWMSLFLIFTILPTVAFYLRRLFKKYQVMMGIPFFYLAIICILDSCTIKDLYGITSHGELDKSPAWVDALLVTFIIVFFQYIGLTVINLVRRPKKRTRK